MAEYIDKAVVLSIHEPPKSNRRYQTNNLDDAYGQGWDDALYCIEQIPAANVVPVVYSRWEGRFPYCTICGEEAISHDNGTLHGSYFLTDYCPHCGAKMQEGAG